MFLGGTRLIERPLVSLHTEVHSPPFSKEARLEAGFLLRRIQPGAALGMPLVRPMPVIGQGCYELRIDDAGVAWRIIYRVDPDAIVVADVFSKKTTRTPAEVIARCKRRLRSYDNA